MDPWLGKILLHSVILKCLDPVLTITCMLAYKSPFLLTIDPRSKRDGDSARRRLSSNTGSDHMAMLKAFQVNLIILWRQAPPCSSWDTRRVVPLIFSPGVKRLN